MFPLYPKAKSLAVVGICALFGAMVIACDSNEIANLIAVDADTYQPDAGQSSIGSSKSPQGAQSKRVTVGS